uniref:Proline rich 7, synaptic n=1 Tax=Lepisosteus oculatus TaxID=7918 RepID=W5N3G0_LEPOC
MVMSQGTYTFLTCFAGFWLVWALIVMLCCFCSFVQRRLKRHREERLRERGLRGLEMDPPGERPGQVEGPRVPELGPVFPRPDSSELAILVPGQVPFLQISHLKRKIFFFCFHCFRPCVAGCRTVWTLESCEFCHWKADAYGKPPCYEEAVMMEDPPPPYSEVLADSRGGTYTKLAAGTSRKQHDPETSKTAPEAVLSDRSYAPLIHLPGSEHWDSLGRLLSTVDLNRNNLPSRPRAGVLSPTLTGSGRVGAELRRAVLLPDRTCTLPTAFPLFGRSTAV